MNKDTNLLLNSVFFGFILAAVFAGFFALGWWWLPAPNAWGKVVALLALVNACIGFGYLVAQRPPE